jgi:hypothetical protein
MALKDAAAALHRRSSSIRIRIRIDNVATGEV